MKVEKFSALGICYLYSQAETNPGPLHGRKNKVNEKLQWHHRESKPPHPTAPRRNSSNSVAWCYMIPTKWWMWRIKWTVTWWNLNQSASLKVFDACTMLYLSTYIKQQFFATVTMKWAFFIVLFRFSDFYWFLPWKTEDPRGGFRIGKLQSEMLRSLFGASEGQTETVV